MMNIEEIGSALEPHGLISRGGFEIDETTGLASAGTVVLVGSAGSAMWDAFTRSDFYKSQGGTDGSDNPMDDWTRQIIDQVADELQAKALYPFEGPPYYPFQRWAMRAEAVFASPTGPLVHPEYGLWHAYRAALVFDQIIAFPAIKSEVSPCATCPDKPCMQACPVDAFKPGVYDVPACVAHLQASPTPYCRTNGCFARHACPVGQKFAYSEDQAGFHMGKFVRSQLEQAQ